MIQRLNRNEKITPARLNRLIDEVERSTRINFGPRIAGSQDAGGITLAAVHAGLGIIWSDVEPAAGNWPGGWLWVDTSVLYDTHYRQIWIKTQRTFVDNNSKVPLTVLVNA